MTKIEKFKINEEFYDTATTKIMMKINEIIETISDKEEKKEECKHEWKNYEIKTDNVDVNYDQCIKCKTAKAKDQPSKPSIREEKDLKYRISYMLWNENNFTKEETDKYADQILDLVKKDLTEKINNFYIMKIGSTLERLEEKTERDKITNLLNENLEIAYKQACRDIINLIKQLN